MRKALLAALLTVGVLAPLAAPAGAVIPGVGVISRQNMEWVWNNPQLVGSDIEFYEELQDDGSVLRYAITGSMGNGFNIYDINDPTLPVIAGSFVDPGINWQGDVQVNPRRKIVVLATQGSIGRTASHGQTGGDGLAIVDISDVSNPTLLGTADGLDGAAHNSTIIDDEIIYTTGAARMVDYSDPTAPKDLGQIKDPVTGAQMCSGHDITVDPNRPNIIYNACGSPDVEIWNVSDPRNPRFISKVRIKGFDVAHQADPNLDSSLLFVSDEQGGGLGNTNTPGGGLVIYDISGKFVEGASLENPVRFKYWVIPFTMHGGDDETPGQWGNLTAHNFTFQAERNLVSIGWYTVGSWVADMSGPTKEGEATEQYPYDEWSGNQFGHGPTTWGNTTGNILLEGAETWSAKWTRFDDPLYERYVFTNDITRGFDVLEYTGFMPLKEARLSVDATAAGGTVSGVLDRYAVWTHQGWANRPLAGKTLNVSVTGGPSTTVTTGDDGSFSASLGLAAGTHDVTVTWEDPDEVYSTASVTQQVTV